MQKEWKDMTAHERLSARFERWLNPSNVNFSSENMNRVGRVINAITLEKQPDRVPTLSPASFLPCFLYGVSCKEAMYDIEMAVDLWLRFLQEYPTDLADR